ncbi:MAG: hypothetical protein QXX85_08615 [Candidatus Nitrosotenuis sp.]
MIKEVLKNYFNDQNMKYKGGISFLGTTLTGYVIYRVLDFFEPQIIKTFLNFNGELIFLLATLVFIGLMGYGFFLLLKEKFRWYSKSPTSYTPNHQEYWNHIEKIRKSLEEDIAKYNEQPKKPDFVDLFGTSKDPNPNEIPNFYQIIKKSTKKTELLQHLFTYFTYPEQRKGDFSWNYVVTHMMEKESKLGDPWKEEAYKFFNKEFQHVYEIMGDSKPLVGLCDGCKMDYYGEDKEKCLIVLENFHRDKEGFIRKLFYD